MRVRRIAVSDQDIEQSLRHVVFGADHFQIHRGAGLRHHLVNDIAGKIAARIRVGDIIGGRLQSRGG